VPAAVEVKAGTRDVFFDLIPVDNLLINGRQRVSVTAQAAAFGANSSELEVEDDETPPVPQQPIPSHGATNVAIPLRLAWNPGVGNILANGNFETGELTGWSQLNTGFGGWSINDGKLDPDGPDEVSAPWRGKFSALLTQYGSGSHQLYQDIVLPVDALGATLTWNDRIRNHATHFASNQAFRVEIRDTNNVVLTVAYATQTEDPC
jgi:hypothetical protein